jgi:hypothetical protein
VKVDLWRSARVQMVVINAVHRRRCATHGAPPPPPATTYQLTHPPTLPPARMHSPPTICPAQRATTMYHPYHSPPTITIITTTEWMPARERKRVYVGAYLEKAHDDACPVPNSAAQSKPALSGLRSGEQSGERVIRHRSITQRDRTVTLCLVGAVRERAQC